MIPSFGTIPRLVMRAADRYGGLAAVSDEGVTLTFADLAASVDRAARALAALGVSAGDRGGALGAQHLGVGRGRARRPRRGARWCPSTPASRGSRPRR